jgi:hypothetical protein
LLPVASAHLLPPVLPQDPTVGQATFTCLAWLVGGLVALGNTAGDILIYQDGSNLRARLAIKLGPEPQALNLTASTPSAAAAGSGSPPPTARSARGAGGPLAPAPARGVVALAPRARGFVAAGTGGELFVFDPPDGSARRCGAKLRV